MVRFILLTLARRELLVSARLRLERQLCSSVVLASGSSPGAGCQPAGCIKLLRSRCPRLLLAPLHGSLAGRQHGYLRAAGLVGCFPGHLAHQCRRCDICMPDGWLLCNPGAGLLAQRRHSLHCVQCCWRMWHAVRMPCCATQRLPLHATGLPAGSVSTQWIYTGGFLTFM